MKPNWFIKNQPRLWGEETMKKGEKDCSTKGDFIFLKIWLLLNTGNLWHKNIKTHP